MYFCRRRAATQATQTTQNTQTASQQVTQQATQTTQTAAQQATQTASQTAARQAVRTVSQTQRLTNWVILVTGILDLSDRELFNIDEFLELFYDESDGSVDLRALEHVQRRLAATAFPVP